MSAKKQRQEKVELESSCPSGKLGNRKKAASPKAKSQDKKSTEGKMKNTQQYSLNAPKKKVGMFGKLNENQVEVEVKPKFQFH